MSTEWELAVVSYSATVESSVDFSQEKKRCAHATVPDYWNGKRKNARGLFVSISMRLGKPHEYHNQVIRY